MPRSLALKTGLLLLAGLCCLAGGGCIRSETLLATLEQALPLYLLAGLAGVAATGLAGSAASDFGSISLFSQARLPPKVIRPGDAARRQQQQLRQEKQARRSESRATVSSSSAGDDDDVTWSEIDLGRLTLAGWMLFLSTLLVLVVFIAAVPKELGREVGSRGVGFIGFLILAGWFGGGRLLMSIVGLRMMRPK